MPMYSDGPYVAQVSASMRKVRGEPVVLGGETLGYDEGLDADPFVTTEDIFNELRWEMDWRDLTAFREATFGVLP